MNSESLLQADADQSKRQQDITGLKQLEQDVENKNDDDKDDIDIQKVIELPETFSDFQKWLILFLVFLVLSSCSLTVFWSRIYLGVHSLTQVITGALLGFTFSEYFFSYNYQKAVSSFSIGFFLSYENPHQRRYLILVKLLLFLIFNTLLSLLYLLRLSHPPEGKSDWIANTTVGTCSKPCSNTKTFEWKDYTGALFLNLYMTFDLAMNMLNKEAYRYNEHHWRHMHWRHVILRNVLLLLCTAVAFAPELMIKPLKVTSDIYVVAARFIGAFALSGLVVYIVPSIYRTCNVEARDSFI